MADAPPINYRRELQLLYQLNYIKMLTHERSPRSRRLQSDTLNCQRAPIVFGKTENLIVYYITQTHMVLEGQMGTSFWKQIATEVPAKLIQIIYQLQLQRQHSTVIMSHQNHPADGVECPSSGGQLCQFVPSELSENGFAWAVPRGHLISSHWLQKWT